MIYDNKKRLAGRLVSSLLLLGYMANNRVFLNDKGIIEVLVLGDQNAASVELMGRELSVMLTQQRAGGKPALILDDLLQIGAVDAGGRKLVVDLAKRADYDRLAMVGKGVIMRLGTNLMLRAVGQSYRARYFDDRGKALAWLNEKLHS